ncbi:unnamed protein product, partial [Ixodes hexagonus]
MAPAIARPSLRGPCGPRGRLPALHGPALRVRGPRVRPRPRRLPRVQPQRQHVARPVGRVAASRAALGTRDGAVRAHRRAARRGVGGWLAFVGALAVQRGATAVDAGTGVARRGARAGARVALVDAGRRELAVRVWGTAWGRGVLGGPVARESAHGVALGVAGEGEGSAVGWTRGRVPCGVAVAARSRRSGCGLCALQQVECGTLGVSRGRGCVDAVPVGAPRWGRASDGAGVPLGCAGGRLPAAVWRLHAQALVRGEVLRRRRLLVSSAVPQVGRLRADCGGPLRGGLERPLPRGVLARDGAASRPHAAGARRLPGSHDLGPVGVPAAHHRHPRLLALCLRRLHTPQVGHRLQVQPCVCLVWRIWSLLGPPEKKGRNLSAFQGSCPGLCPTLGDCQACMVWGAQGTPGGDNGGSPSATGGACGWCVQAAACHPIAEPPLVCRPPLEGGFSPEQGGFWGPHGHMVGSLAECRTLDFRPGLFLLQHLSPANLSQPDQVWYVNNTGQQLVLSSEYQEEQPSGGEHVARLLGFLHPLGATAPPGEPLRLFPALSDGRVALWLGHGTPSDTPPPDDAELVANLTTHTYNRTEARRPDGQPLLPSAARELRYLLDLRLYAAAKTCSKRCEKSLELRWNALSSHQVIGSQHLEPYRNGTACGARSTCLGCLSDAACGWCRSAAACVARGSPGGPCAPRPQGDRVSELLVLEPEHCSTCSTFIYCQHCTKEPSCEWVVEGAYCARRGRHSSAVRRPDLCPTPCHLRRGCTSCLGDPGRCAWCRQTQSCFLFSTYTTSFMYGGCREWVDEDHGSPRGASFPGAQCPNCSVFKECGACLHKLGCGWCGNDYNPRNGVCVEGDFSGPYHARCEERVAKQFPRLSGPREASWSYAKCPNVNECKLKLAHCHPDARCVDTAESYRCVCNRGFKGDGNTSCVKTCTEHCVHGQCSEAPEFRCLCELGWTGTRCDVDCGCHNHSSCEHGVGLCDRCYNLTQGQHCQLCRQGSFGNATTSFGCRECVCNGHGDEAAGTCNSRTGDCRCLHNTQGKHCEVCSPGYFGDPRRRGLGRPDVSGQRGLTMPARPPGPRMPSGCAWPAQPRTAKLQWPPTPSECVRRATLESSPSSRNISAKRPKNWSVTVYRLPFILYPSRRDSCETTYSNCLSCMKICYDQMLITVETAYNEVGYNEIAAITKRLRFPIPVFSFPFSRVPSAISYHLCSGIRLCGIPNSNDERLCSLKEEIGGAARGYGVCRCEGSAVGVGCGQRLVQGQPQWALLFDLERSAGSTPGLPQVQLGHSLLAQEPSQLWLFGGTQPGVGPSDALHVYDLDFNQWKKVNVSREVGHAPAPRWFHGAAMVGTDMYVFGGLNTTAVLGDFWKFTTDVYTWSRL